MIIYSKYCLACTNKPLWKKVKAFAKEHGLLIIVRRTTRSEWREEANQYGVLLPFAVEGKTALSLTENLEELLK